MTKRQFKQMLNEISVQQKYEVERANGKTSLPFGRYSQICALDPTTKPKKAGKYCNWLLQRVTDYTDLQSLKVALEQYHDGMKRGILQREGLPSDIGQFKTCEDLIEATRNIMQSNDVQYSNSEMANRQKLEGQFEVYLSNKDWDVIKPLTWEAERYFGRSTEWCTVANDTYFNDYTEDGPLYINYPKNGDLSKRMQFHFESDSYADVHDDVVDTPQECIYKTLGETDEADALVNLWAAYDESFAKCDFYVTFRDVPYLLREREMPVENIFDIVEEFVNGYAIVKLRYKYNFINKAENRLVSPNQWYDGVEDFSDGFAIVWMESVGHNFINEQGILINNKQWYQRAYSFSDGFALIFNGMWNFLKKDGTLLDKTGFTFAYSFFDGYAVVQNQSRKYNILDDEDRLVSKVWLDDCGNFDNKGFAGVTFNGVQFRMDKSGIFYDYKTRQRLPDSEQMNLNINDREMVAENKKRKIYMTESQNKIIENANTELDEHLSRDITYNNTSLSDWDFLNTPTGRMLLQNMTADRYNEVKSYFKDDVSNISKEQVINKLREVMEKCRRHEDNIRPQLQQLCVEIMIDIFNPPENSFSLECALVSDIDADKNFDVNPMPINAERIYNSMDDYDGKASEIVKRRIIDCLSMGLSMKICEKCINAYMRKLFELDEELPYLYSRFLKLNDLYLFKSEVKIRDKAHQQGGYVEVMLGNEDTLPKISAKGMLFPILLTETIKGFMELFASHGLPDDIEAAKDVINVADALSNEPWDMRLGPILCDKMFGDMDEMDSTTLPYFYSRLVESDCEDFKDIVKAVICDVGDVHDYLNDMYLQSENDKERDEFDCEFMRKQEDGDELITDQEEW